MKAYLSHPISGLYLPHVRELALQRKEVIETVRPRWTMVLPTELKACEDCHSGTDGEGHVHTWQDWMLTDLRELLMCDVIVMCQGWMGSPGARTEFMTALACGMPAFLYYDATPGDPPMLLSIANGTTEDLG